jgi:hypothetical protein
MKVLTNTQLFIYLAGIFLVLFLLGMVSNKTRHADNPFDVENFDIPEVSSDEDVSSGASSLYGWGYTPIKEESQTKKKEKRCPHCENIFVDVFPNNETICKNCDITKNKDIDKYVLKSSVPPCPNMNDYALKSQLPPAGFNPDEWIRKSEIPPCPPQPDMKQYIRKDEIPPCEANKICPKCPQCPVCPKCPPCKPEVKIIYSDKYNKPRKQLDSYFPKIPRYLPQNIDNYPQSSGLWRPKLSDTNSGFISPDIPLAGNVNMTRRVDELKGLS